MSDIETWVLCIAAFYVISVYPFIKYIQLIRQDLRDGKTEHPINLFINL